MTTAQLHSCGRACRPGTGDNRGTADDYVGRWNVKITDAQDTFVSGGIRIDKNGDALSGGLVWRWGSYAPVKSVEVKDGVLRDRARGEGRKARRLRGAAGRRVAEGPGHISGRQGPPLRGPPSAAAPLEEGASLGPARSRCSTGRRSTAGASATRRRRTAGPSSTANSPSSSRRTTPTSSATARSRT